MAKTNMRPLDVHIVQGLNTSASLKIEGKNSIEFLGWKNAVKCYKMACDIINVHFNSDRTGSFSLDDFFLYEGSYYWVRSDGLNGIVLWLYMREVINNLLDKDYKINLITHIKCPDPFIFYCKNILNINVMEMTSKHGNKKHKRFLSYLKNAYLLLIPLSLNLFKIFYNQKKCLFTGQTNFKPTLLLTVYLLVSETWPH